MTGAEMESSNRLVRTRSAWLLAAFAGVLAVVSLAHLLGSPSLRNALPLVLLLSAVVAVFVRRFSPQRATQLVAALTAIGVLSLFVREPSWEVRANNEERAKRALEQAFAAKNCRAAENAAARLARLDPSSSLPNGMSALRCSLGRSGADTSTISAIVDRVIQERDRHHEFKFAGADASVSLDELAPMLDPTGSTRHRLDVYRAADAVRGQFLAEANEAATRELAQRASARAQIAGATDRLVSSVAPGAKGAYGVKRDAREAQQEAQRATRNIAEAGTNPLVGPLPATAPANFAQAAFKASLALARKNGGHYPPLLELASAMGELDPPSESRYVAIGSAMVGCIDLPRGLLCAELLPGGGARQLGRSEAPASDVDGASLFADDRDRMIP